jgi:hypothetical protein
MDALSSRDRWRQLARRGGWMSQVWELGGVLRPRTSNRRLFVLGTPTFDAWHVAAHLDDAARLTCQSGLRPTLLRAAVDPTAPAHLRHGIDDLRDAARDSTVLVVAPDPMNARLLEHLADSRKAGALLVGLHGEENDVAALLHEGVDLGSAAASGPDDSFGLATHLVSVSAAEAPSRWKRAKGRRAYV